MPKDNRPTDDFLVTPDPIPYRASWVDRLIRWIKRLPIPPWLFFLILLFVQVLILYASRWIAGSAPFGSFDQLDLFGLICIYGVGSLASIHYINETAARSFNAFLPALGLSEQDLKGLRYELLVIPRYPTLLVSLVGFIFGFFIIYFADYSLFYENLATFIIAIIISNLGFTMTAVLLYHTVHQLRTVSRIHGLATSIDLMNLTPVYAFSRLSSLTGLIFLLILWFDLLFNQFTMLYPGLIALNFGGLGVLAIACFILPLSGMHQRLVVEKQRLLWEVDQRIKDSMNQLMVKVDTKEFSNVDPLNKAVIGLISTHDFIFKISTWPWRPETFTFFVGALAFPIIIFLIQTLLKNLFGI